jgi:hypothetical protein
MNSSQQQFLNKGEKASVKNPNTEADPVPFALFWSELLQSPTGDAWWRLEFFKVQKRGPFWPTYAFSTTPMDFFAFSHGFQHKKFTFTAWPLAHRSACQSATYTNAGPISQKFVFMLHQSGKNNKLGSVKNSRGFVWTLQADFSKGFDIGFFKGVSDDLQGMLSKRQDYGSGIKEKDGKNIGALFKPEPDK